MYRYILESNAILKKTLSERTLFKTIPIIIKDPFLSNIDLDNVISEVERLLPYKLMYLLDNIYVGQFDFLTEKKLSALYSDNTVFINNIQKNDMSVILGIIHELSHAIEEKFGLEIYGDKTIAHEFAVKRTWLFNFIKDHDIKTDKRPFLEKFNNLEYDEEFDNYLFNVLDYYFLLVNTPNVFLSPYSITSLSEYFSIGFERFFGVKGERALVQKLCPKLYIKLEMIEDILQEGEGI